MQLVIGNKNYSSWSLRAWLALAATGADFEEILIPLDGPQTKSEIARYSPAGRVPVLIDGDLVVWDSLAIIEYLADKYPEAGLWSKDRATRAVQRSICAEMHSGFAALRSHFPMNMRKHIDNRPATSEAQADIDRICGLWRQALAGPPSGGPYLYGAFSAADAMYAPVVSRLQTYKVAVGARERAYMDAVLSNRHFQAWANEAAGEQWVLDAEEKQAP